MKSRKHVNQATKHAFFDYIWESTRFKMQASLVNLVKRKIIWSKKQTSSIDQSYNLDNWNKMHQTISPRRLLVHDNEHPHMRPTPSWPPKSLIYSNMKECYNNSTIAFFSSSN